MAITATQVSSVARANGEKFNTASLLLDNSMPAGGYPITPAMFGLSQFKANAAGSAFIDPEVVQVQGSVLLARIQGLKLICSYPTGSSLAVPAAVADPIINAGAVAVTGSAATGPFAAGRGKDVATATDLSAVTVVAAAAGF